MKSGAAQVGRLQQLLSAMLDVPLAVPIAPHLIGPEVHRQMPGARPDLPEQIFVRGAVGPGAGEVEVSVYIAPHVLASLVRHDPFAGLSGDNLDAFWIAVEGVSHFVMTAWRAAWSQPVSALELEIQAEADKFVAALLLASQVAPRPAAGPALWRRLFADCLWQPSIPVDERERYRLASRVAAPFCRQLVGGDRPSAVDRRALLAATRRWFRRPLALKLRARDPG